MKTYLDPINNHYIENPDAPDAIWELLPERPSYGHIWDSINSVWALAPPDPFAYRTSRAAEYPPQQDYIDAQVKKSSPDAAIQAVGIAQEAAYFAACLAVKDKYPKGA